MVWLMLAYDWLSPMKLESLEKHYNCCKETIAVKKGVTDPLSTSLLVSKAWIQLKIEKYWR